MWGKMKLVSIAGALFTILLAYVVANGQTQSQSIINTSKSNTKDSVAPSPQEGINTSRSNIKNTSRQGGGRFDPIQLDLMKASGEKVANREVADADNDGKISQAEGAFDFGMLPAGDYVLTFKLGLRIDNLDERKAADDSLKHKEELPYDTRLSVELNGVVGGPLKQELTADLSSQMGSETARAGKPKYKNITLKTDGHSVVKGTLRHDASINAIQNTR